MSTLHQTIQQIKERADKAKDGPWIVKRPGEHDPKLYRVAYSYGTSIDGKGIACAIATINTSRHIADNYSDATEKANADFIAAARTDIPALCNALEIAVEALERRLKRQPINAKEALGQIEAALTAPSSPPT